MEPIVAGTTAIIRLVILHRGEVYDPAQAASRTFTILKPDHRTRVQVEDVGVGVTEGLGDVAAGLPCLEYQSVAGDFDQPGIYSIQGVALEAGGQRFPTRVLRLEVLQSIQSPI